jgi:hypothetical protein
MSPPAEALLALFFATIVIFFLAVLGLSLGSMLSGRCLRGSCGAGEQPTVHRDGPRCVGCRRPH